MFFFRKIKLYINAMSVFDKCRGENTLYLEKNVFTLNEQTNHNHLML